ncbi:MAG: polyprenyl synthetase family protein [Deltaproteobacteria bacterium]|nr:MAG: polyprenyl synthetase family protein [Deltaproteobacteria bacterium]
MTAARPSCSPSSPRTTRACTCAPGSERPPCRGRHDDAPPAPATTFPRVPSAPLGALRESHGRGQPLAPSLSPLPMNVHQVLTTLENAQERGVDAGVDAHLARLRSLLGDDLQRVEEDLPRYLESTVYPLAETGQHLVAAGGKRIRPALVLLGALVTGQRGEGVRRLAIAGELVHIATLLHDDVIDDAPLRRNAPTPRVVWSNTASVLGGDYALTRALDLVDSVDRPEPLREAIATLRALVEGEILQVGLRTRERVLTRDYFDVAERKTASLFRWCCRAGAHLSGDTRAVDALGDYGANLGICFQIVDDVLDFEARPDALGKALLADLAEGKPTLPVLLALEEAPELQKAFDDLRQRAAHDGASDEDITRFVGDLKRTRALQHARRLGTERARSAVDALTPLPESEARDALVRIATSLAARVH